MSNDPKKTSVGAVRIVMKQAVTTDKQKEFLEDLARVCDIPVDEISNYSFPVTREEETTPKPQ